MKIPSALETERLVIRPYTPEDFEPLYAFFSDEDATRLLDLAPEQKTAEGTRALLEMVIASYETEDPIFAMAITDKESGKYIGSCGMAPDEENSSDTQIFYALLPQYQGNGYATEAARKLLEYAFVELDLDRIVASIAAENLSSIRVAERLKMIFDGKTKRVVNGVMYEGRRYRFEKSNFL